jgi:hypothetical protein
MKPENDRAPSGRTAEPARKKRFRLERLEQRIAPKRGGKGTNNCPGNGSSNFGTA